MILIFVKVLLSLLEMNIDVLTSMGYSAEESEEALKASNGDLNLAIELLCNKGQLPTILLS